MPYKKPKMQIGQRPMTEEQKLAQRAQIYLQKKESYALNAALKLIEVHKPKTKKAMAKIVALADNFSETLLETLFLQENETENEGTESNDNEED